jgi:selenocysteine lyase/cysteine desulfurase
MLITPHGAELRTVVEGGTGTESLLEDQPSGMPERMESGTQNMPGIAGLRAGIGFVRRTGREAILQHEIGLLRRLYRRLSRMDGIVLYTPEPDPRYSAPVLSFNVSGLPSEETGRLLGLAGFAVRAGLHCAPEAHRFMGTLETGAVRVCPSVFSTAREMDLLAASLENLLKKTNGKH